VITRGTKIEGHLSFDAPVRIDGAVRGEVLSSKQLVFGKHSVVEASVFASSIVVEGILSGEVHVREVLILKSGARLNGKVIAPRLVVEEGAELNAQVWRSEDGVINKKKSLAASVERTVDSAKGARSVAPSGRGGHDRIEIPASAAVH
jgi:cytoskeletal protein CcmA (bactofilin family)